MTCSHASAGPPAPLPPAASGGGERPAGAVDLDRLRAAPHLVLLLDYDGTLVPFAPRPELARPDAPLLALLAALAARADRTVHVVSGRPPDVLDRWLGALPIGLHAEHGAWSRRAGGPWIAAVPLDAPWRGEVRALFLRAAGETPGALVEEKTAGLAWHHRLADPIEGARRARALAGQLAALLASTDAEVLAGAQVIEVRRRGIHKGLVVAPALASAPAGARALAIGDDQTDEDLFAALPAGALAVHVGPGPSRADLRAPDVAAVRSLLGALR